MPSPQLCYSSLSRLVRSHPSREYGHYQYKLNLVSTPYFRIAVLFNIFCTFLIVFPSIKLYNKISQILLYGRCKMKKKERTFEQQVKDILLSHPEWRKEFKEDLRKGGYPYAVGPLFDKYTRFQNPAKYDKICKQNEEAEAAARARETQAELCEWQLSRRDNAIQCPYCKSWDTDKITVGSRVVSVALVGVASSKIGKEWHCNKCGSNF